MNDRSTRAKVAALLRERAVAVRTPHALSYGQRSMWLLHRMAPDSAAYHIAFTARVEGGLDAGRFQEALLSLVARHPALRSTFGEVDGEDVQTVRGWLDPGFEETAAHGWPEERLRSAIEASYARPFTPQDGPLIRAALWHTASDETVLLLVVHHLVADFRSLELALGELSELYEALGEGRPARLSGTPAPYTDHVAHQRAFLAGEDGRRARQHWHRTLAGELPVTRWPAFRTDPGAEHSSGESIHFDLDDVLAKRLHAFARRENVTVYAVLASAFTVLVARTSGQEDVLIGTPVAGRTVPSAAGTFGYFTDPVVLRTDLGDRPSFTTLVRRTRRTVIEALEHQEYPFELLVEELAPRRAPGVNPVFQSMFIHQKPREFPGLAALHWGATPAGASMDPIPWGGVGLRPYRLAQQEGQLDLLLETIEDGDRLLATLKYRPTVFSARAAHDLVERFCMLLGAALEDPDRSVALLPFAEVRPQGGAARAARPAPTAGDSLLRRFADSVARHADRPATRFRGRELTYRDLDESGAAWAERLRAEGVGPGDRVALLLEPSLHTVTAVVATLKRGAAYVPLDPHNPAARLRFLLADCGARVVLTTRNLAPLIEDADPDLRVLTMDEHEDPIGTGSVSGAPSDTPAPGAGDLLYTVYTSGSTGAPKGIDVEHGNVLALLDAMREHIEPDAGAVWTLFHSTAFDVSVWELWGSLLSGACLVVVPADVARAPDAVRALLVEERVTHLNQTPSALHGLAAEVGRRGSDGLVLRHTFSCGELLTAELARSSLGWCGTLWNLYGPAETTVCVTAHAVEAEDCGGVSVPVGVALSHAETYVLDAHRQPVPAEVTGELYVGGPAVARGYHNRAELNRERYLADPFTADGGRMYRTGDLARVNADGLVEILGRVDNQVKVSGYRIELEEIEAVLDRDPEVERSVVLVEGAHDDGRRLTACVVPVPGGRPEEAALRARLRGELPEYMLPASFVVLDALPLNPNQKVDRGELARRVAERRSAAPAAAAPAPVGAAGLERTVAGVWERVLRREGVGPTDNFFDLGGTSMLLLRVHSDLSELPGGSGLAVSELFAYTTVAAQARRLRAGERNTAGDPAPARAAGPDGDAPSAGRRRAAMRRNTGGNRAALRRDHRGQRDHTIGENDA
ncbi:amino acid adenylation domain-containing protein [Streptomyces sp. NPDC059949]|uniref:non-ribosomal peptide synthetase n=1 Tax=Streptomyces sp. NPDC059949 TaxID=3347013 RepID=UPI00366831C6